MAKYEARVKDEQENLRRVGDYKAWGNEKRLKARKRLRRIIHSRVQTGIASSVVFSDYDELITPNLCTLEDFMEILKVSIAFSGRVGCNVYCFGLLHERFSVLARGRISRFQ